MNKTLPERPDLEQLKKQGKDLLKDIRANRPEAVARVPQNELKDFSLADAQRIVAREYGFPSWAKLKLHVETREQGIATAVLVSAAAKGDSTTLRALLQEHPELVRATVSACAVLADLEGLRAWVAKNPEFATAKGGVCDTEALGYVCLGKLGGDEAARVACAEFLLAHGADPNATWRSSEWPDGRLPVLYTATGYHHYPALARRLLAAGANPNDGESIYHAAENNHVEALEALLAAGGDVGKRDEKWKNTPLYFLLGHSPNAAQAQTARAGMIWLLEHGANPNVTAQDEREVPLFAAIRNGWDVGLIEIFLKHGADARAERKDTYRLADYAVRCGREDVVALLVKHGAVRDPVPLDEFLGALARGDTAQARRWLIERPSWAEEQSDVIMQSIMASVKRGEIGTLETALALGLDFNVPDDKGETPLHYAALHGQLAVVRRLIAAGATLTFRDKTYHAPPLGWCVHGSIHFKSQGADYPAVAEALLAAGAERIPIPRELMSPGMLAVFDRCAKA